MLHSPSSKGMNASFKDRFATRIAVITGGADGIGFEIAKRLGSEGASLAIFDSDPKKSARAITALRATGLSADSYLVDVSDEAMVNEGFASVMEKHSRIDAVVHAAGIVGPNALKTDEIDVADFDRVIQVNLRGSFLVARAAVRAMLPQDYGRILLFASIAGKEGNAGMAPYSTSKAGVIGLTKSIGKEYAETGVTINAIAPAVIRTAMVDSMADEQVTYMTDKIPMKRCGTLAEAASLSAWIVSPEASFSTGAVFDLSGGRATY